MQEFRDSKLPLENDQHLANQFSVCFGNTTYALLLFGNKIKVKPYKS